jgi:hypothetical protein
MQHERAGVEPDEQILRAPAGAMNALACYGRGDVGIYAPAKTRLVNLERDDLAADDMRFDAATSRLDFR